MKYYYDGKEISHMNFIDRMCRAGLSISWRRAAADQLEYLAGRGVKKAVELLSHIKFEE